MSEDQARFACKTEGCDQQVVYQPLAVSGLAYNPPSGVGAAPKTVYLTCVNQHTHPYLVDR